MMDMNGRVRGTFFRLLIVAIAGVLGGCGCAAVPPQAEVARPEGAGCTNVDDGLSGGRWFGLIKPGSNTSSVKFDLVCFFVDDAELAAAEDGEDPTAVYNSYVRNRSSRVRTVPVCAGASALLIDSSNLPNHRPVSVQNYLDRALKQPGAFISELTVPTANHCISSMSQLYSP